MEPFWQTKRLEEMTRDEWESLCDGCGRCCLHKLRHDETDELSFTNVACRLLDLESCRCGDYARRQRRVPDCVNRAGALEDHVVDWPGRMPRTRRPFGKPRNVTIPDDKET